MPCNILRPINEYLREHYVVKQKMLEQQGDDKFCDKNNPE
jgi:hypothetical protein